MSQTYSFNGDSAKGGSGSSPIASTAGSSYTAPTNATVVVDSTAATQTPQSLGVSIATAGQ